MQRQFVVQLDNRPGELAHLARALAARGVNITHISCVGAAPRLRLHDHGGGRRDARGPPRPGPRVHRGRDRSSSRSDRPGGLADVAERLAAAGVNVLGTLCVGRRPGVVEMTFCVDDEAKARAALAPRSELAGVG